MTTTRRLTLAIVLVLGHVGSAGADWKTSGNDMYSNVPGNVGIGTTTPEKKLHVVSKDVDGAHYDRHASAVIEGE